MLPASKFVIARDDLNHPSVSGNKLHKLAPQLELARRRGFSTILSFGGPYSNHLHALAWACKNAGLNSVGLVRGELHEKLTPTLEDCQRWGMTLRAMPRVQYRTCQDRLLHAGKTEETPADILPTAYVEFAKDALIVPEGGSNRDAIASLARAYKHYFDDTAHTQFTHAACATGTGATLAGLRLAAPVQVQVIGVQAVAEGDATIKRIKHWLPEPLRDIQILPGHLGGFAKTTDELMLFIDQFEAERGIALDPVYTGKLMYKLAQLDEQDYFTSTDKVLVLHTGGLQGRRGFGDQDQHSKR